jgi:TolB-like protein/DNA-binding SARP family transcriptional activator
VLEFRVLGEFEVVRDGAAVTLPPSRKTRALLAYLALTGHAHRRERLCEIFWDVPDDPRGALRWSLSKIRPVVDDPAYPRLIADRNSVELRTETLDIDFLAAQACVRVSAAAAATCDLVQAASSFRAPLLADLDLPANSEFHSWLLSLREDARKLQAQILRALTERLGATPDAALSYARELVRIDPYDETAWALLITNLAAAGRSGEVGEQYEAGLRALRDVGGGSGPLLRAWRTVHGSATRSADCDTISAASPDRDPPARNLPAMAISRPATPRLSIVVLPFVNLSNDPEQQYFADGITGDLITDLSRIPDMLVISRYTAFTYRDKPDDIKQIGRELGVRYALEGEVQRSGTRVRVTAQLIDAESDTHLWAERFDGDPSDLFAWQDEITNRIAVALDLELVDAAAARPSERPDARLHFARARATAEAAVA